MEKSEILVNGLKELKSTNAIDTVREVTFGRNGYPVPVGGIALFPNKDRREEFQELFDEVESDFFKIELAEFHWRDGWGNCEYRNYAYDFDIEVNFGDDVTLVEIAKESDIKKFIKEDLKFIDDEIAALKKHLKNADIPKREQILKEIEVKKAYKRKRADDYESELEIGRNYYQDGCFGVNLPFETDYFYDDTHNYRIGYYLNLDDLQRFDSVELYNEIFRILGV